MEFELVEMTPEQREMALYEEAVEHFGEKAQILQTVEEMAELTKALLKYIRYKDFGHGTWATFWSASMRNGPTCPSCSTKWRSSSVTTAWTSA